MTHQPLVQSLRLALKVALDAKKQQNAGHHEMTSLRACKSWIPFYLTRNGMFTFLEVPPPSFLDTLINVSGERFVHMPFWSFPKQLPDVQQFKEKSPFQTYQTET